MKLLLWNVNGIRAISKKEVEPSRTFDSFISKYDIVILNETKISEDQLTDQYLNTHTYCYHSHSVVKRGYSGVCILTNEKPLQRLSPPFSDDEGRVVILEFRAFILIGVYTPNSGTTDAKTKKPKRIEYRTTTWDNQFRALCKKLEKKKPLIVAGDLNVAHQDCDVYNPTGLRKHAGFTEDERSNFQQLIDRTNLVDAWRNKHPTKIQYSYFDYRSKARSRNAGWRIDYFLVSSNLSSKVSSCEIVDSIVGSDHLPVRLNLN